MLTHRSSAVRFGPSKTMASVIDLLLTGGDTIFERRSKLQADLGLVFGILV